MQRMFKICIRKNPERSNPIAIRKNYAVNKYVKHVICVQKFNQLIKRR